MSLRRNRLDDAALAELDALDAALRGEEPRGEHAGIATLVADVRDAAPRPTPAFLAELDARVREGFPPRDEPTPARERARPRRRRLLLGAGAIAVSAAVAVATVGIVGSRGPATTMSMPVDTAGSEQASPPAAASPEAGLLMDRGPSSAAPERERSVERSAALDLTVAPDEVQSTADEVVRATDRVGGIVQTSSINTGEDTGGEARFELRVPSDRLDDALAAYSKLGSVASRTQDAEDITGTVMSAESRLSDARAERRGLLRALGQADTRREVESLRARLQIVRQQIARYEAELRTARRRADLATVSVTVRGTEDQGGGAAGGGWSLGDALRDAARVLEVGGGVLIVALAVLLPLGLVGLAGTAAGRALTRRRRERGLDAA